MFRKKHQRRSDEELDRAGKSLLLSAAASDEETDKATSSPFLFARIAARIEEEERRRSTQDAAWLISFREAKRAIALLALVAVAAFGLFWSSSGEQPQRAKQATSNEASIRPASLNACSLASTDECAISSNDVLATLFAEGGAEK